MFLIWGSSHAVDVGSAVGTASEGVPAERGGGAKGERGGQFTNAMEVQDGIARPRTFMGGSGVQRVDSGKLRSMVSLMVSEGRPKAAQLLIRFMVLRVMILNRFVFLICFFVLGGAGAVCLPLVYIHEACTTLTRNK